MAEMIRKQVYIEARQERLLKERARRYKVTEAELIRRAIDRGLERAPLAAPDPAAWEKIERFIARRRARARGGARAARPRDWTRDELHDR